jgi:ATP-dependent Clp protease adaptor protein ClpS
MPEAAVIEEQEQQTECGQQPRRQPPYNVVLWNDDHHTFEEVIAMLQTLFGHPWEKAVLLSMTVHTAGKAIVLTSTLEHAELKRDQIHAYPTDAWKGPLQASVEPAA